MACNSVEHGVNVALGHDGREWHMAVYDHDMPGYGAQIEERSFPMGQGFELDMRAFSEVLAGVGGYYRGGIKGLAFAVPGEIDSARCWVLNSRLPGWTKQPLVERLAGMANTSPQHVWLGTETEDLGVSEARMNHNLDGASFFMVSAGADFGMAHVNMCCGPVRVVSAQGSHVKTAGNGALVSPARRVCYCGRLNCASGLISMPGIRDRFGRTARKLRNAELSNVAIHIAYSVVYAFQNMPSGTCTFFTVVVGGELPQLRPRLVPMVEQHLNRRPELAGCDMLVLPALAVPPTPGVGLLAWGRGVV
jgi:predicted NBD/HSP70 family sugar kinase